MNEKTATAQSIPITPITSDTDWQNALVTARANWNSGMYTTTGFNVYTSGTGNITLDSGNIIEAGSGGCGRFDDGSPVHGCVKEWYPNTPSGRIYMYSPVFSDTNHRVSDLMHAMGHVLYNAGGHYGTTPAWDCSSASTRSIMCHSYYTAAQPHDIDDYKAAYEVREVPNATYALIPSTTDATHYFEGGYQGGIGYTSHQERDYWIDRSTNGVNGSYSTYVGLPRIVNNSDDDIPNSWVDPAAYPVPWPNAEWCFKTRG